MSKSTVFAVAFAAFIAAIPSMSLASPFRDARIARLQYAIGAHSAEQKLAETRATKATGGTTASPHIISGTATITFEDLAPGAVLSNQYTALYGVTFSPDELEPADTDQTVVSSTGTDIGALGTPPLVSGNIVHSFDGWLSESSFANTLATLTDPVQSVSVDFAGNASAAAGAGVTFAPSELVVFDAAGNLLADVVATPNATSTYQTRLTVSSAGNDIAFVGILPGDFDDWVGWDNFTMSVAVPEPMSLAAFGMGALLLRRRR